MKQGDNLKSVKELFRLLIKNPELRNFTVQYVQFKIKTLVDSYCYVRWRKSLVKEVFWKRKILFLKVSDPTLKKELGFHIKDILEHVNNAGFKFQEIKLI